MDWGMERNIANLKDPKEILVVLRTGLGGFYIELNMEFEEADVSLSFSIKAAESISSAIAEAVEMAKTAVENNN